MTDAPAWVSPVLTLLISLVLPYAIQYVATSSRRIVNYAISLGSSIVLGVLSAWSAGEFASDVWINLTVAIAATQTAYNGYWKDYILARRKA